MKQLHFEYDMTLAFDSLVEKHRFTLKCFPHTDERQEINNLHVEVFPNEFLCNAKDPLAIPVFMDMQRDSMTIFLFL